MASEYSESLNLEEYEIEEESELEENHTAMTHDTEGCVLLYEPPPKTPTTVVEEEDEDMSGVMLEPDHPLLAKFQATLKEQLEKQLARLSTEVADLENGIKKKCADRDILGVTVYDAQQMVSLQYETLGQFENEIQKVVENRNEIETAVKDITENYKQTKNHLIETEKKENELAQELTAMNFMYQKMESWEKKLESDLAVQQRIQDKSKIDRKKFADEKRNLDFVVYKLMTEVFKLENNLDHLTMQLRVREEEREVLATQIANSNTDIELLEAEQKRLMHSWNCVVVAIRHRDKLYDNAKKELGKEEESLQGVLTQIIAVKKGASEEMARNEQLTLFKGRLDLDKTNLKTKLRHERDKMNSLEKKVIDTQAILTQTNRDLEEILSEKRVKEQAVSDIRRDIEKQLFEKVELENEIFHLLQEQLSNDKVSKYMNKTIRDLRETNRELEINLATAENKNAGVCILIEQQRGQNMEITKKYEELEKEEQIHNKEVKDKNMEIHKLSMQGKRSYGKLDDAIKKYDEILKSTGGVEMTPTEAKIKDLEKTIQELDEKNSKLKSFWLRQECYIIQLKDERQNQLQENRLKRRQLKLLQQQNLRLEDELDELERKEKKFERNMNNLKFQIDKINTEAWKRRGQKEVLNVTNTNQKIELEQRLNDAEMECLVLENKCTELEEEKEKLSQDLVEANRETLAWERKDKLAMETKISIKEEKSTGGELSNMKAEIHRMNVRYSQLRRVQDKMVEDLNHCISRREFIYTSAEATEKKLLSDKSGGKGNQINTKVNLQRKLEDMKKKLKKSEREANILEIKINKAQELQEELKSKIGENEEMIYDIKGKIVHCRNDIDIGKFDRQKELELLVFQQHKLHAFSNISRNIYRPQFKTDTALDNEYIHQLNRNKKLQTVIENLILNFPGLYPELMKILNTLRVIEESN